MRTLAACISAIALFYTSLSAITVTVDQNTTHQTIEGIGVAQNPATYTSEWKYKSGPFYETVNYDEIHYYDTIIVDAGFTCMRDDPITDMQAVPGDFTLPDGVRHELQEQAKLCAAADRAGEPFFILWNCFSPPAWMKANNSINAVPGDVSDPDNYLLPEHYEDFADHWVRVMEIARDTFGLTVDFISLQNEPLFNEPYASCNYGIGPGCGWNGICYNQMFRVVAPRIAASFPDVKFVASEDLNRTTVEVSLRADPISEPLVYAWATHNDFVNSFAYWDDRPIWNTEPHPTGFLNDAQMCMSNLEAGASVWMDGGNRGLINGECDETGLGTPTTDCMKAEVYSSLKMFSRYIRPGAVRIASTGAVSGSYGVSAYYHPGNECLTIVLINATGVPEPATLSITGSFQPAQLEAYYATETEDEVSAGTVAIDGTYTMPANSVSTLVAGTYRATGSSTFPAQRISCHARLPREQSRALYTIDGRLIGRETSLHRLAPGLYCRPAGVAGRSVMAVEGVR